MNSWKENSGLHSGRPVLVNGVFSEEVIFQVKTWRTSSSQPGDEGMEEHSG